MLFVVKDISTNQYWCGYNTWDKQLRKAKIFTSYTWAVETRDNSRFIKRDTRIFTVEIKELDEYNLNLGGE